MAGSVRNVVALSIQVARFIAKYEGFAIASTLGELIESYDDCNELGVLWSNPSEKPKKYFFGLFEETKRRKFVGILWIDNKKHGATRDKWIFEVFGKDEYQEIEPMVKDLAVHFNVEITLYLSQERCYFETFDVNYY